MKYITAKSPKWANAEQTAIDLIAEFEGLGAVPFTASGDDTTAHGKELFQRAQALEFGPVAPYAAPPVSREQQRAAIDAKRDAALAAGVVHAGARFYADDTFLTELLGRIMGYQAGVYSGSLPVRTKDGATIMLDQAQHVSLAAAVGAHRQATYAESWAAKDALQ